MQNIDVRFNATSNFGKVKADLAALEAQAASLRGVFTSNAFAKSPAIVDPTAWQKSTRAVHEASNAYRNAVSSSGLLTSQQIRATAESEKYTKSLQRQKLTLGEMTKHQGIMKQAYQDQLRYQRMTAQYWGTDTAGRAITDITIPQNVPRDLDTVAQKLHFTGQMARSAGTQIINMGKNMQWAGRQLTVGFSYPVALFGAAAGVMAYKVDEAMTQVTKVYDVSAAAQGNEAMRVKELADVRTRSMEMASESARKYGQSIEDTLGVESALASTGLSGEKLFQSTDAVQRIATLGDLDLTSSTDMTIALQSAFRDTIKTTDDLSKSFDFMNAVENATSLTIKDIAEAVPRAASSMGALGVTVEEMTVLLTAMREAGVNAAQGANALKSATGTILSPSPAAIEFIKEVGGQKLADGMANLRETTGGNLYKAIEKIYNMTRDLSADARQAVIVKMFGKYQFDRISGLVNNLGAAFDGTQNQARAAMDLMGQDSAKLAANSERELGQKMEAVSGRFKAAWQEMRIELAEIGVPFLKVATIAAKVGGSILSFFNDMSDTKKYAALVVAGLLAVAGPIVMLGGLFMNLAGQFVTGSGRILSALGRMGGARALVTKEEQAAILSAEAQNAMMDKQVNKTSTLAQEVTVLTAAYEKATVAARAYAQNTGVPGVGGPARVGPHAAPIGPQLPPVLGPVPFSLTTPEKEASRTAGIRALQIEEMKRQQAQVALNRHVVTENKLREKTKDSVHGAGLATAAMGVSLLAMTATNNEFVNELGKWLMIGTIVVPAVKMVSMWTANAAKSAWSMAAGNIAAAKAAKLNAAVTGASVSKLSTTRAVGGGLLGGLSKVLGPAGWATLGVTAVVGGFYALHKHSEAIREDQKIAAKNQATLVNQTDAWAESMGKVGQSYKQYATVTANQKEATEFDNTVAYYKSDEQKDATSSFNGMSPSQQDAHNWLKYIELVKEYGMTQKQAERHMAAFFHATGQGLYEAQNGAKALGSELGNLKDMDWGAAASKSMDNLYSSTEELLQGNTDKIDALGKQAGAVYNEAFLTASSPSNATDVYNQMKDKVLKPWEKIRQDMISSGEFDNSDPMMKSAETLRAAYMSMNEEQRKAAFTYEETLNAGKHSVTTTRDAILDSAKNGEALERSFIRGAAEAGGLAAEVDTLGEYTRQAVVYAQMLSYDGARKEATNLMNDLTKVEDGVTNMMLGPMGLGDKGNMKAMLKIADPDEIKEVEIAIRAMADENNIKPGATLLKTYNNLLNGVKNEAKGASGEVEDVSKKIREIKDKSVTIKINQVGGIVQTAMGEVQSRMADSAMTAFNERWDNSVEAAQNSWDNRMENMTASHDAAQRAMDNAQQNAQDAFDRRWDAREKAVEKEYDRKIERINREIEAEQRADRIRQELFEKEKARLEALAERSNTNVDFNTQLNEGKLDEAAKTLTNAGADSANKQMEAEERAAEKRTEAKIAALEKKNERLEKARDKELENLEKLEERMRKHLERVQDARRRALEKQQADEVKALEKAEEGAMDSLDRQRKYEEATLQQRLDLFVAYTARNKKDLERWMKQLGFEYDDFGKNVEKKGKSWAKTIRESMLDEIKEAGIKVMNDNLWERVGKGVANKLLRGLGFDSLAAFNRFVNTGRRGGGGGGGKGKKGGGGGNAAAGAAGGAGAGVAGRHEGGVVDSSKGSRKGVPRNYKGLHRTEQMILAQKGEYVVNKKSSEKNRATLEAINSGMYDSYGNRKEGTGGPMDIGSGASVPSSGFGNIAGLMSGAISNMFMSGVGKAFNNANAVGEKKEKRRQARRAAASGKYGSIKPGVYGDTTFNAEQLANAKIIASVGKSMGMSGRDIQIGLMTAMQESTLRNLNYGDRDSVGLFQQRTSMGWGSIKQIMNPRYSAGKFFSALKGVAGRDQMPMTMAAQAVQRSAYPTAYAKWRNEAAAIYKALQQSSKGGGGVSGPGGSKGGGKYWRASDPGKGWNSNHDYDNDYRSPVYAIGPGTVRTAQLPPSAGSGQHANAYPRGYGSYGVVSYLTTDDGQKVTYAHLWPGTQVSGRVQGGQRIALSASTGNSSGSHTHFEVNGSGSYGDAKGRFAAMGIGLRTGGTVKYDETPARLHKGETVLTAPLTQKFKEAVQGRAGGNSGDFNVTLDLRGAMIREDVDIEKAVHKALDARESKLGRKRVVK